MAPRIFYRVEDRDSRARYFEGQGIFAEDTDTWIDFRRWNQTLYNEVERHLDWGSKVPTPFISVYTSEDKAYREAKRRVEEGREDVKVYTIDTRESDKRIEYRSIRGLAEMLDYDIPECALNNSKYEYVFLHFIPESAVVECDEL